MGGRRFGWLAMVALCGCGAGAGSGAPAETAGVNEEPPAASAESQPDEVAPEVSAKAPAKAPASGKSESTTLAGDDLAEVLQDVLNDPELVDHLHLEKPGRAPLQISGPNLPDKIKVVAGSYNVDVVSDPKSTKKPVLVFTLIERSGEETRVHYRYDVEGIKGAATLFLKGGHWTLSANRVIEK